AGVAPAGARTARLTARAAPAADVRSVRVERVRGGTFILPGTCSRAGSDPGRAGTIGARFTGITRIRCPYAPRSAGRRSRHYAGQLWPWTELSLIRRPRRMDSSRSTSSGSWRSSNASTAHIYAGPAARRHSPHTAVTLMHG